MILCHIKYNSPEISDDFGEHTFLMIIREPTERIISHYEYFITKKNNIPLHDLSTDQLHKFCSRKDVRDTMTDYLSHSKKTMFEQSSEIYQKIMQFITTSKEI